MAKFLREPHGGAKRAKHRAKRSPECGDPAKQGHAQRIDYDTGQDEIYRFFYSVILFFC